MAGKLNLIVLVALFPILAFAQTDTTKRKVIVYNPDAYFGGYQEINNVIKMSPLLVFTGDIPIFFERKLTEKISAEGAVGVTTRNYLRDLWEFTTNPVYTQGEPAHYSYSDIIGNVGFSLRLAGRYYPLQQVPAPHEFYFGPSVEFRSYSYSVPKAGEDPATGAFRFSPTEVVSGSRRFTDLKIMFGYNDFFEKNVMVEYYGGVGLRFRTEDRFDIQEVAQPQGGNIPQTVILNERKTVPILSAGIKIGFGWK